MEPVKSDQWITPHVVFQIRVANGVCFRETRSQRIHQQHQRNAKHCGPAVARASGASARRGGVNGAHTDADFSEASPARSQTFDARGGVISLEILHYSLEIDLLSTQLGSGSR